MIECLLRAPAGASAARCARLCEASIRSSALRSYSARGSANRRRGRLRRTSDLAAVERIVADVDGIIHLGVSRARATGRRSSNRTSPAHYNLFEAARRAWVERIIIATRTMRSAFIRVTRRSTIGWCHARTAATAFRRPLPRRSPASMPTSTASDFCAPASAISGCNRSTDAGFRSGSAHAITRSCAHRPGHPDIRYEIVYGVSNNQRSWYDNSNA